MWARAYKDYPPDTSLVQQKVEPGKGIIGCEMHDYLGWGTSYHIASKRKKPGVFKRLWKRFFHA